MELINYKGVSMKERTKNLSKSVIVDAMSVAGGLYSMNAKYAYGYGFNAAKDGKSVCYGMFINKEDELFDQNRPQFDGFLCKRNFIVTVNGKDRLFKAGTVTDLISNESIEYSYRYKD